MPAYFDKGLMVGQSAWHKEGTVIPEDDDRRFDIAACIGLADMDDTIIKGRCFYVLDEEDGQPCDEVEGSYVTVRRYADGSYKALGTVGSKYQPLQPREAFDWFQPWLETREVSIETAGTLQGGRVDWVMARILRDNVDVGGGDEIAKYLMLSTAHDGSQATYLGFTPQRVVCSNTLAMATSNNASKLLRVRHTKGQEQALSTIRETIDLIDREFNATGEQYRTMMECKVNLSDIRAYVKMVNSVDPDIDDDAIGKKIGKRINDMVGMAVDGLGQSPNDLTAWSAYNGVTQYLSHKYGSDNEKRVVSMMRGTAADMGRRAYDLALQLAS